MLAIPEIEGDSENVERGGDFVFKCARATPSFCKHGGEPIISDLDLHFSW